MRLLLILMIRRQIYETKCREREYLILFSSSKNGRALKPYHMIIYMLIQRCYLLRLVKLEEFEEFDYKH